MTIGYLSAGRPFSQIGNSGLSIYLGECLLVGCLFVPPVRAVLSEMFQGLTTSGDFHGFLWIFAAWFLYGFVHLIGGMAFGAEPMEAAKIFAFHYLPAFLFLGVAVRSLRADFLQWLCRWLPWFNAGTIIIFKLILQDQVGIPFNPVRKIAPQSGTMVVLALMLCFERPLTKRWYLFAANAFVLLFMQVRAGWLAVLAATLLWALLTKQLRLVAKVGAAGFGALLLLAVLNVSIPGTPDRGGRVTAAGILARSVAPFDEQLAAKYSDESAGFNETAQWREDWWRIIWHEVHKDQGTAAFGLGTGQPLSRLAPFIPEEEQPVRAPHNFFFFALGYEGWVGVVLVMSFQVALGALAWKVWRARAEPFGLMLWVMGLAMGFFDNFYETPFAAVPMYFLFGVTLAPMAPRLVRAAQRAALSVGCP